MANARLLSADNNGADRLDPIGAITAMGSVACALLSADNISARGAEPTRLDPFTTREQEGGRVA